MRKLLKKDLLYHKASELPYHAKHNMTVNGCGIPYYQTDFFSCVSLFTGWPRVESVGQEIEVNSISK